MGRPDAHAGEVPVAYVELAEGSKASIDDIMNYAKQNIGERAAIPKEINIIPQVPLTAVGKIFKPALRWDATKKIYEEELAGMSDMAASMDVSVVEDKVHGTNVTVKIKPAAGVEASAVEEKARELLSRYTLHCDIVVE